MVECPSCGKQHRPGTLFCTECGVYLPAGGTLRTSPLPTDELPHTRAASQEQVPPGADKMEGLRFMNLHVIASDRHLRLPAAAEVLLGRLDAAHGIFPDLDLTPDGGLEKGVSRRHAKIIQRKGDFFIEDLGSANGTFLNDQRLTPYLPYPLKTGDKIQIGRIELAVDWESEAEGSQEE